ncbi:tyrosine-type recombinase/integrase [Paenibacillus polymyxa]|uniref:Integrase n=1 Tax=Paenibacillus polymyxa TaxID=1406 RepID=A0ABX2ZH50_PAEPO|nr:site-specific integrase [Paenibacillus polymyxa]ODA10544.1 integrase [Paenibacillus polymyxa]
MEGSFYKRGSTWSFMITIGTDPKTGKRKQKGKGGFKTKKEAQAAAADLLSEINRGVFKEENKMTFEELAEKWLKYYSSHGKPKKDGTIRIRTNEKENLSPFFAKLNAASITEQMYQDALISLQSKLADNTLSGVHSTGRMIFSYGLKIGALKTDPTSTAFVPKRQKTIQELEQDNEMPKYLERDELVHFLQIAQEHGLDNDFETFNTLAYTGIRVGELCALKELDVNFEDDKIRITKTLYNPNNNYALYKLNTPKTVSSVREIDVDHEVIVGFQNLLTIQQIEKSKRPKTYHDQGFIFARIGKFAGYPQVIKMVELRMKRLLKLAGLNPDLTPHSLRHTHTSLLAEAGATLEQIMQRLGHANDEITRRIYLHITKPKRKEAAQKFSELMRASKKSDQS